MNDFCQLVFPYKGRDIKLAMPYIVQIASFIRNCVRYLGKVEEAGARYGKLNYIVDIGAGVGGWTLPYAFAFPYAEILAIEPSKYSYPYLRFNCKDFPNIKIMKILAHNKQEQLSIANPTPLQRHGKDTHLNPGLVSVYGASDVFREMVDAISLNALIKKKVDWLKIDVEGHEIPVLEGASRILSQDRPMLQIEVREVNQQMAGRTLSDLYEMIGDSKYVVIGKVAADLIFLPMELL